MLLQVLDKHNDHTGRTLAILGNILALGFNSDVVAWVRLWQVYSNSTTIRWL